jgi:hypothetical protein
VKKGYVISHDRFHKFIVRRLLYFIEETDNYMKINYPPRKYPFEEWKRVYLYVLMDEIHPFLYSFEGIPHQNIYDEIQLTLSNTLSDKMEKMYYDTPISESVSPSVKRRGEEFFRLARNTYPYLYPCDYNREGYVDSILIDIGEVLWDDSYFDLDVGEVRDYLRHVHGDHFLSHWDYNCSSDVIKESTPVIKNKSIEDKVMKAYDRGLSKLLNSDVIKDIYPMIDRSEVFYLEDDNLLILRVFLNDPEIDENNMYSKGFDPHYLMDVHLTKFLPYFDYKSTINKAFVLYGPNGENITSWLR